MISLVILTYDTRYLIHSPFFAKSETELQNAWAALEKIKESGKAKSIGVSNYLPTHLEATLKTAKIPPAINQVEFHPYLQRGNLVPFHEEKSIKIASYGPLTPITRAKGGPLDNLLSSLSKKYAVSEGDIILRWVIQRGVVAITTTSKEERLLEYLQTLRFNLLPNEAEEISKIGSEKHFRAFFSNKFAADDRS